MFEGIDGHFASQKEPHSSAWLQDKMTIHNYVALLVPEQLLDGLSMWLLLGQKQLDIAGQAAACTACRPQQLRTPVLQKRLHYYPYTAVFSEYFRASVCLLLLVLSTREAVIWVVRVLGLILLQQQEEAAAIAAQIILFRGVWGIPPSRRRHDKKPLYKLKQPLVY